jgi:hypothetical protein
LTTLIVNDGALNLEKLFDGTTDASQMGKIRKMWRDHLGVQDDELKKIISQLRIQANAHSGNQLDEYLSTALHGVRLQPLADDKKTCIYTDLIYRLHDAKEKDFDEASLRKALEQEELWLKDQPVESNNILGIRTFSRGTEAIESETDSMLCLLDRFEGRYIKDSTLWQSEVAPSIRSFIDKELAKGIPITLHLDTHISSAFTAGYLLDGKTGVTVRIVQKRGIGR